MVAPDLCRVCGTQVSLGVGTKGVRWTHAVLPADRHDPVGPPEICPTDCPCKTPMEAS